MTYLPTTEELKRMGFKKINDFEWIIGGTVFEYGHKRYTFVERQNIWYEGTEKHNTIPITSKQDLEILIQGYNK